jgi:hypothetical protein
MQKPRRNTSASHSDGDTTRPETPELEGITPLPEEVTGKASSTDEDLVSLFDDADSGHMSDGFRGGSDDDDDDESVPD